MTKDRKCVLQVDTSGRVVKAFDKLRAVAKVGNDTGFSLAKDRRLRISDPAVEPSSIAKLSVRFGHSTQNHEDLYTLPI